MRVNKFEIIDTDDIEFKEEPKVKPKKVSQKPALHQGKETIPSKKNTSERKEDYKPAIGRPGNPRIYEVVIQTVDYNKSGRKINYSHTIKYPGWSSFFEED